VRLRWDTATSRYVDSSHSLTRAALLDFLAPGEAVTFAGVPFAEIRLRSNDRDGDGFPDSEQIPPSPLILRAQPGLQVRWNADGWHPESAATPTGPWRSALGEPHEGDPRSLRIDPTEAPARFFRMRRNW